MISLLHPSYQRPEKSFATVTKWVQKSGSKDFEFIISLDEADTKKEVYLEIYTPEVLSALNARIVFLNKRNAIQAINEAARVSEGNILIVVSDDTDCPENWVQTINQATVSKQDFVMKVYDNIQKWIVTMPIMDRAYYNRYGYVYNPIYRHLFCDAELAHVAEITGKLIFRNDITFPHLHYSVTKEKRDAVSEASDATCNEGKAIYLQRVRDKFGLNGNVDLWKISNQSHINWLKQSL